MADSGYTASDTVIPAFKRVRGASLTPEKQAFNTHFSHMRVEVEHCIGMIKNRWQSLKDLRLKLSGLRSAKRLVIWIRVCVILHNMLLDLDDSFDVPNQPIPSSARLNDRSNEDDMEGENTDHRDQLYNLFVQTHFK